MKREKQYTVNEYIIGYDSGVADRSCLLIGEVENDNINIKIELFDDSADVINIILDNLQNQLHQKEIIIKAVRQYIKKEREKMKNHQYAVGIRRLNKIEAILDQDKEII